MNILIDINHPAHVHLFKNAVRELEKRGHKIHLAARDKDVTIDLLRSLGMKHEISTKAKKGKLHFAIELLEHDYKIYKMVKMHGIEVMLGTSPCIAHVGRITKARSIVFNEDNADAVRWFSRLTYPFADQIITPVSLNEDHGKKHVKVNSYHELAYLHPNHFKADPHILSKLNVNEGERYFIIRFASFLSHHDYGEVGLSEDVAYEIIRELSRFGKLFVSSEKEMSEEYRKYRLRIAPHEIHDALAYAKILISDSQTMTAEAAVLGIPSIRCNTFVGRLSYLDELEHRYGLTFGFLPNEADRMMSKIRELLMTRELRREWLVKRDKLLKDKIDFNQWIVDYIDGLRKQ